MLMRCGYQNSPITAHTLVNSSSITTGTMGPLRLPCRNHYTATLNCMPSVPGDTTGWQTDKETTQRNADLTHHTLSVVTPGVDEAVSTASVCYFSYTVTLNVSCPFT